MRKSKKYSINYLYDNRVTFHVEIVADSREEAVQEMRQKCDGTITSYEHIGERDI